MTVHHWKHSPVIIQVLSSHCGPRDPSMWSESGVSLSPGALTTICSSRRLRFKQWLTDLKSPNGARAFGTKKQRTLPRSPAGTLPSNLKGAQAPSFQTSRDSPGSGGTWQGPDLRTPFLGRGCPPPPPLSVLGRGRVVHPLPRPLPVSLLRPLQTIGGPGSLEWL